MSAHPNVALGAVFAASLLQALAVVGTVIPGSSIVFIGGILVGLGALDPWQTVVTAVTGAIIGDGISYWLGHHYRHRLPHLKHGMTTVRPAPAARPAEGSAKPTSMRQHPGHPGMAEPAMAAAGMPASAVPRIALLGMTLLSLAIFAGGLLIAI